MMNVTTASKVLSGGGTDASCVKDRDGERKSCCLVKERE